MVLRTTISIMLAAGMAYGLSQGLGGVASAQPAEPPMGSGSGVEADVGETGGPEREPGLTDASLERVEESMEYRPTEAGTVRANRPPTLEPVTPARSIDARAIQREVRVGPPSTGYLWREGTLVTRRVAVMLTAPTGESIVVFDAPRKDELLLGPMVVLPCLARARMEALASMEGAVLRFSVSGELTTYRGRNYLLVTSFARAPDTLVPVVGVHEDGIAGVDGVESEGDVSVEDLIRDLEERRNTPRGLMNPRAILDDDGNAHDEVAERLGLPPGVVEGAALTRQTGRLVRLDGGELAFVRDSGLSDVGGTEESDEGAPLVIMPGQVAVRLEKIAAERGDGLAFELSGRVYGYEGVGYVLPVLAVLRRPSDVGSLQ